MGLFGKNEENREQEKKPVNPQKMLMVRLLAMGYLIYLIYSMVNLYLQGGEDAPSVGLLIASCVFFAVGAAWIGFITFKQYKRMKAEQQAAWEEEERLEAAAEEDEDGEEEAFGEEETDEE